MEMPDPVANQYVFNLATSRLSPGCTYVLQATVNGVVMKDVLISLVRVSRP